MSGEPPGAAVPELTEPSELAIDAGKPVVAAVEALVVSVGSGRRSVQAVRGVDLEVRSGEIVGLVGESGSGKSTLARSILAGHVPSGGRLVVCGTDITGGSRKALSSMRRRVQLVPQDPYSSLNPRMRVEDIIAEPLFGPEWRRREDVRERVTDTLELVRLDDGIRTRYARELSGGQRQRVAIARALAPKPDLIVADEPLSALDTSIQASIINLLREVVGSTGVGLLLISHDIAVVRAIAQRIYVMYRGQIVETGPADVVLDLPEHPYTDALLSSVPEFRLARRTVLTGEADPAGIDIAGCSLHTRCPYAQPVCLTSTPPLQEVAAGHQAACHFSGEWAQAGRDAHPRAEPQVKVPREPGLASGGGQLRLRRWTRDAGPVSRHLASRAVELVATVAVVMTALFLLLQLTGNPAAVIAGESSSPSELAAVRARYGLNESLVHQYLHFVWSVLSLNLGSSFITGQSALGEVMARVPATLGLTLAAMAVNIVVSGAIGIAIGAYRKLLVGRILAGFVYAAQGIPFYVISLLMVFLFTDQLHALPSLGDASFAAWIMPSISLAWFLIPQLSRFLGASIERELGASYIKVARASGASYGRVVVRHALPNALVGSLALAGTQFAYLISGTLIIEQIFSWPGLGQLLLASVTQVDFPVVEACVVVIAVYVVVVKVVTDLLTMRLDPRLRDR
jgi:oligopeptide/dipeptide ABC transporter ATP-binding protein